MSRTADLTTAIEHALRAPSVHNTQPWRWRIRPDAVELHADWNRHLVATDPDRRDLVLSCGAALHHLAGRARGRRTDGAGAPHARCRGPRPPRHHRGHGPARDDAADAAQFRAIDTPADRSAPDEPSDRAGAPPAGVGGAGPSHRLAAAPGDRPGDAAAAHRDPHRRCPSPGVRTGLRRPSCSSGPTGTPPGATVCPPPTSRCRRSVSQAPRPCAGSRARSSLSHTSRPGDGPGDDAAELLVIVTAHDDPLDWLRAGEATSAVLLAATGLGLATTPLSQPLEVEETRRALQQDVLRVPEHPQLVVRVGWPATGAAELPSHAPSRPGVGPAPSPDGLGRTGGRGPVSGSRRGRG